MGTFNGTKGADALYGTSSGDTIYGDEGNDTLKGFGGSDILAGGPGIDTAFYGDSTVGVVVNLAQGRGFGGSAEGDTLGSVENVYGSLHNDTLTGDDQANLLHGLDGNDILKGGGGADRLEGGYGDDTFKGGGGADALIGGPGIDTANYSMSQAGVRVSLYGNAGSFAEAEGDRYSGIENVTGSAYGDHLEGDYGANVLRGLDQNDMLYGNYGRDTLDGGAGNDRLYGQGENDRLIGGPGHDSFFVEDAGDVLVEYGGEGYDVVYTWVNYTLTPGAEVEALGPANYLDTTALNLTGNEFANYVSGNLGDNVINGGDGADRLAGYGGRDRFLFDTPLNAASNVDTIVGFDQDDTIVLENTIFGAFAAGPLAAERFVVGPAALEANDTIIYNPASGALFYDVDGSGAGAAIQFATLPIGLGLTENDFVIV